MRYHEAIVLGATLRRQFRGATFGIADGEPATCVNGAAMEAVGMLNLDGELDPEIAFGPLPWEDFLAREADCPTGCGENLSIAGIAAHLSDQHGWTRQQVAEWVRPLECAESAEVLELVAA
jgi:hypothetical protein